MSRAREIAARDLAGKELILDADNDTSITADTDDTINFKVGGSDRLTINSSGDIDVETGDIFFSGSAKGINLGVTSNTNSNTLDDYEEGTYTFAVTLEGSGTASVQGAYNTGNYVKIGQLVNCGGDLRLSGASSPNGEVRISLPFSSINNTKRLFVSVALTVGISAQTNQTFGGFFIRTASNEAKASVMWQNGSSHFGLQGENAGLGNGDTWVHSHTYLIEV